MNLTQLVDEINTIANQLEEAELAGGAGSLKLTERLGYEACSLLTKLLDPKDSELQANLSVVASAIGKVQPADMAKFLTTSEWSRVTAALGDVAMAIGVSDRSVTHVLNALAAVRPPAQPDVPALLDELNTCKETICKQAALFHGDLSLVQGAIRHERARILRRRIGGVIASVSLVGVGIAAAPILGLVSGAIVLAGLGAGAAEGVKMVISDRADPGNSVQITNLEFIVGEIHLHRHQA
jgi:hypothetical protein